MDPESRKRIEESYPKFAGKPLENYDLLKRADCLALLERSWPASSNKANSE